MRENTRNVTNNRSSMIAIEVHELFSSILQDQEQDLAHTAAAICRAGLYRAGCWGWRRAIACKSSSKEGCANPKTPTKSWGEPAYVRARKSFAEPGDAAQLVRVHVDAVEQVDLAGSAGAGSPPLLAVPGMPRVASAGAQVVGMVRKSTRMKMWISTSAGSP